MNEQRVKLLDQIIEFAKIEDARRKVDAIARGKGEETVGDNWMVCHLNLLKELLEEDDD